MSRSFVSRSAASCALPLLVLSLGGCAIFHPGLAVQPLPDDDAVVFPFDTTHECTFQIAMIEKLASDTAWAAAGDISNHPFHALARKHEENKTPAGLLSDDAVELRDASNKIAWIRLEPKPNEPSRDPLNCAVPLKTVESLDKPLRATTVRILPTAPSCHALDLFTGEPSDVDFQPYSLLMRRLYKTTNGIALGVTVGSDAGVSLQSEGRARLLTVSEAQFNNCFASTARAPMPLDRRRAFFDWLPSASETAPPPDLALDPALVLLGVDEHGCLREGLGASQHRECRASAVRILPGADDRSISFFRDRLVDAFHGYGDDLIGGAELAGVNFVLGAPSGKSAAFTKEFEAAVTESVMTPHLQNERANHGYRLLRRSDLAKVQAPSVSVQVEAQITPAASAVAISAPAAPSPSPAPATAPPSVAAAPSASRSTNEAAELGALFGMMAPSCLDPTASAICNLDAKTTASMLLEQRSKTPAKNTGLPPMAAPAASAGPQYRAGEVTLKLTTVARDSADSDPVKTALGSTRAPILVDSSDPPSAEDLDRAAARATVRAADRALQSWMSRSVEHPPENSLLPGTRAYMTLLARHVASNRRVKLITDLMDDRPETLASGDGSYPIKLTEIPSGQCYAFVAAASDGTPIDLNLSVRHDDAIGPPNAQQPVGRDARPDATAGLELCNLEPGAYRIEIAIQGAQKPTGVVVSMFESTADKVTDSELHAAADGSPTRVPHQ